MTGLFGFTPTDTYATTVLTVPRKRTKTLREGVREPNTVSGVWLVTYATYGINKKLHYTMHYTHTHNMTCAWCLVLPIDDMGEHDET